MKKLTLLICLLAAAMTLGACSSSSQTTQSEEEATQQKLGQEEGEETAEESAEGEEAAKKTAESAEKTADETSMAKSGSPDWCPAAVEGVKAEAAKGEGKMSLAMMTSGDNVSDLQKRAKMMAERHNQMHGHHAHKGEKGKGKGMKAGKGKGMKAGERGHGVMGMASAEYEETEKGAMLHFTPAKAEHMTGLEKQVGKHAKWINKGECPGREMAEDGPEKGEKDKPGKAEEGEKAAPATE